MFKKFLLGVLSGIVILTSSLGVFATESNAQGNLSEIESNIIKEAYEEIKEQIIRDYSELYKLEDFEYIYSLEENQDDRYISIDVYT